jgi:DNA-directed RNA polymerase alpha subunit
LFSFYSQSPTGESVEKDECMEIDEHLFPTNATVEHLCMLKFYANCGKVSELETRDQLVQVPTPLLKEFTFVLL